MLNRLSTLIIALLIAVSASITASSAAAEQDKLKTEELDQLLAPIALFPDDLLANVLVASTYPLDVVQAARWRQVPANAKLKGEALAKALEAKDWDPSIKALVQFPDVLQMMSDKLEWTQKLGDAFLAQQDEVMDEIQLLRTKAEEAGNLKSNKQQRVTRQDDVIVIEAADPDIVYVPVYQPTAVYGSWWYPDYPPYYWPYPGATFVNGYYWGAGIAVAASIWGWGHCNWRRHDIDVNVNKWNNINVNRAKITSNRWEHNPAHRGPVPYGSKAVRDKFKQADRGPSARQEFRGYDKGDLDKSRIESRLKEGDGARDKHRAGEQAGAKLKGKAADVPKTRDRPKGGERKVSRSPDRPSAKRPSPGAFDVKRGADVRRQAERGRASRASVSADRGGGFGGGHRGGGHRGGGRGRR